MTHHEKYFVPAQSHWPIVGALGLGVLVIGLVNVLQGTSLGWPMLGIGVATMVVMVTGWMLDVINESMSGLYSEQMDRSFRWGMIWFIFSEVMFFLAFFGALYYARDIVLSHMTGDTTRSLETHNLLWPNFEGGWPLLENPDPSVFPNPGSAMHAWGLPAINTALLLTSGLTITWAHWALKMAKRTQLGLSLFFTIALAAVFLYLQMVEYYEAYHHLGLRIDTGIYGSTFFMLTGFHGMHVFIGSVILFFIWIRCLKGHFTPEHHFGFEAAAWYWHFVDVVWLFLFVFVYWL